MILALLLVQAAAPEQAPAGAPPPSQHLHDVVVDAIRNCPKSTGDEIAVCAKDHGYSMRYRIEKLKPYKTDAAPAIKLDLTDGSGATGTGSCGNVGPGSSTGCARKDADAWRAAKKQAEADGRTYPW